MSTDPHAPAEPVTVRRIQDVGDRYVDYHFNEIEAEGFLAYLELGEPVLPVKLRDDELALAIDDWYSDPDHPAHRYTRTAS